MDEQVRIVELPTKTVTSTDYIAVDDALTGTGKISVGNLVQAVIDAIPAAEGGNF